MNKKNPKELRHNTNNTLSQKFTQSIFSHEDKNKEKNLNKREGRKSYLLKK